MWRNDHTWYYDLAAIHSSRAPRTSPDSSQMCLQVAFQCILAYSKRNWILHHRLPIFSCHTWQACWVCTVGHSMKTRIAQQGKISTHLSHIFLLVVCLFHVDQSCVLVVEADNKQYHVECLKTLLHERLTFRFPLPIDLYLLLHLAFTLRLITALQYNHASQSDSMASISLETEMLVISSTIFTLLYFNLSLYFWEYEELKCWWNLINSCVSKSFWSHFDHIWSALVWWCWPSYITVLRSTYLNSVQTFNDTPTCPDSAH